MSITDYAGEFRQLREAEALIRQTLAHPALATGRIALLDQDLEEIRRVCFWLEAGGTGIRSTLVSTIDALCERVRQHCRLEPASE